MKKISILIVVVLLVVICSSCNSTQKCPAYADNQNTTEQNV